MTIAIDNDSKLLTIYMGRYSLATLYMWGIGLLYPGYKCQYFSEILYVRVSVRLVHAANIVFCAVLDEFNLEPRNIFL